MAARDTSSTLAGACAPWQRAAYFGVRVKSKLPSSAGVRSRRFGRRDMVQHLAPRANEGDVWKVVHEVEVHEGGDTLREDDRPRNEERKARK